MSFKTDQGGVAIKADIKVATQASTWNTRLTQLLRGKADITICTFSLPRNPDYLKKLFDKRSKNITLIANSKFEAEAWMLKRRYPDLRIILSPQVHSKMALAAPDKVWLSSENLVRSRNFENAVGIQSPAVYDFYLAELRKSGLLSRDKELEVIHE